jgi:hypothetical protein
MASINVRDRGMLPIGSVKIGMVVSVWQRVATAIHQWYETALVPREAPIFMLHSHWLWLGDDLLNSCLIDHGCPG